MNDVVEREKWNDYMRVYEEMIRATSHATARWHVVPADHKALARLLVASIIVAALEVLDPKIPAITGKALADLRKVEQVLSNDR